MIEQLYLDDLKVYRDWVAGDEDADTQFAGFPGQAPLPGQAGWISYYTRAANLVLEALSQEDEAVIAHHQQKWLREGLPFEDQAASV